MKRFRATAALAIVLVVFGNASTVFAQQKTADDYLADHALRMKACSGSAELCCLRAAMCVIESYKKIQRDVAAKRTVQTFKSDAMTTLDLFHQFVHGAAAGLRAPACPSVIRLAYTRFATEVSAKLDMLDILREPVDHRSEIFVVGEEYLSMRGKTDVDDYYVCKSDRPVAPTTADLVTGDAVYALRLAESALANGNYPAASAYASALTVNVASDGVDDAVRANAFMVLGKAQQGMNANARAAEAFRASLRAAPSNAARKQALDAQLALALKMEAFGDAVTAIDGKLAVARAEADQQSILDLEITKSRVLKLRPAVADNP
jgi:hypothetical protein